MGMKGEICLSKGGLISKSFPFGLNLQRKVPNYSPEHFFLRQIVLKGSDFAPIFGFLSQSKKLSEVKPL